MTVFDGFNIGFGFIVGLGFGVWVLAVIFGPSDAERRARRETPRHE